LNSPIAHIKAYQEFLASLRLDNSLFRVKTFEQDLKGELNPSGLLDELFFEQQRWLNFEAFYSLYLEKHEKALKAFSNFSEQGLRARLYRTQFGILTEYHAFWACKCIFGEKAVQRDARWDSAGVDFRITHQGITYNIHIFVDTPRAWEYRKFKTAHKNVEKMEGIHLNLPYALKQNRFNSLHFLPNGFGIYTSRYLLYVKKEMESGTFTQKKVVGTSPQGFIYT
jgi:hypothetical protein